MRNRHSFKVRIALMILVLVMVISISMGIGTAMLSYRSAQEAMQSEALRVSNAYADGVTKLIKQYYFIADMLSSMETVQQLEVAKVMDGSQAQQWEAFTQRQIQKYNFADIVLIDLNGNATDGTNLVDKPFFSDALKGRWRISAPMLRIAGQPPVSYIAAPIYANSEITGVLAVVLGYTQLIKDISNIQIGENGYGYIVDKQGNYIAHPQYKLVSGLSGVDSAAPQYAGMVHQALESQAQVMTQAFDDQGQSARLLLSPIDTQEGWTLVAHLYTKDFMDSFWNSMIVIAGLTILFIAAGLSAAVIFGRGLSAPLERIAQRLKTFAGGDLQSPFPQIAQRDEIGALAASMQAMAGDLCGLIQSMRVQLAAYAQGDFSAKRCAEYPGDFAALQASMGTIATSLSSALNAVRKSADQISQSAAQMADVTQVLAQGNAQQADAVLNLDHALQDISQRVTQTEGNVHQATGHVLLADESIQKSGVHMNKMLGSMQQINDGSAKISGIMRVIDDIAFQTNILALNAAVEAARAGAAGKGFAVVAAEVRNLAEKSANAASQTTQLIMQTQQRVASGIRVAKDVSAALEQVRIHADDARQVIVAIEQSSALQAEDIRQIAKSVQSISAVVQSNAGVSQQSTAASQMLLAQSVHLQKAAEHFTLAGDVQGDGEAADALAQRLPAQRKQPSASTVKDQGKGMRHFAKRVKAMLKKRLGAIATK